MTSKIKRLCVVFRLYCAILCHRVFSMLVIKAKNDMAYISINKKKSYYYICLLGEKNIYRNYFAKQATFILLMTALNDHSVDQCDYVHSQPQSLTQKAFSSDLFS